MKRKGNLYHLIPDPENLRLAFRKAARGKLDRKDVIDFKRNFDANIQKLRDQLLQCQPDIGHYHFFQIYDPKPRSICAASFPERVLHHGIMNICEPVLESYSIYDSYACRKGKGSRKAVARAQAFARKTKWYLKLDIRKYFDSIDHNITMEMLSRRFKDKPLMVLFKQILETYHTQIGKGLPIGNLISQHLANFYLSRFDHYIKEDRRIHYYVRYMDDFILFGQDKTLMKAELEEIHRFLAEKLALRLKDNIQLNRCSQGIPFLGDRVFPYKVKLLPASKRRFVEKFVKYQNNWQKDRWSEKELVRHLVSLIEFTKGADAQGFRQDVIKRFGVLS